MLPEILRVNCVLLVISISVTQIKDQNRAIANPRRKSHVTWHLSKNLLRAGNTERFGHLKGDFVKMGIPKDTRKTDNSFVINDEIDIIAPVMRDFNERVAHGIGSPSVRDPGRSSLRGSVRPTHDETKTDISEPVVQQIGAPVLQKIREKVTKKIRKPAQQIVQPLIQRIAEPIMKQINEPIVQQIDDLGTATSQNSVAPLSGIVSSVNHDSLAVVKQDMIASLPRFVKAPPNVPTTLKNFIKAINDFRYTNPKSLGIVDPSRKILARKQYGVVYRNGNRATETKHRKSTIKNRNIDMKNELVAPKQNERSRNDVNVLYRGVSKKEASTDVPKNPKKKLYIIEDLPIKQPNRQNHTAERFLHDSKDTLRKKKAPSLLDFNAFSLAKVPKNKHKSKTPGIHDDDDKSVAFELFKKVKILCWVLTHPPNHNITTKPIRQTWGRRCNKLLFISSVEDDQVPTMEVNMKEGREHPWPKVKAAFMYVYNHHQNDADWFLRADDDTFVIMENLRYMLSDYNSRDPLYFGCLQAFDVQPSILDGGAGVILSRSAMNRLVNKGFFGPQLCRQTDGDDLNADLQLGVCLNRLGVKAMDTRDSEKKARFMPLPAQEIVPPDDVMALNSSWPWYWRYNFYPPKVGLSCCSDFAISFHYVSPKDMYALEYLIYHVRPFGIKFGHAGLPTILANQTSLLQMQTSILPDARDIAMVDRENLLNPDGLLKEQREATKEKAVKKKNKSRTKSKTKSTSTPIPDLDILQDETTDAIRKHSKFSDYDYESNIYLKKEKRAEPIKNAKKRQSSQLKKSKAISQNEPKDEYELILPVGDQDSNDIIQVTIEMEKDNEDIKDWVSVGNNEVISDEMETIIPVEYNKSSKGKKSFVKNANQTKTKNVYKSTKKLRSGKSTDIKFEYNTDSVERNDSVADNMIEHNKILSDYGLVHSDTAARKKDKNAKERKKVKSNNVENEWALTKVKEIVGETLQEVLEQAGKEITAVSDELWKNEGNLENPVNLSPTSQTEAIYLQSDVETDLEISEIPLKDIDITYSKRHVEKAEKNKNYVRHERAKAKPVKYHVKSPLSTENEIEKNTVWNTLKPAVLSTTEEKSETSTKQSESTIEQFDTTRSTIPLKSLEYNNYDKKDDDWKDLGENLTLIEDLISDTALNELK